MQFALNVDVNLTTRKAQYTPNKYRANALGIIHGCSIDVDVFGIFQIKDDDGADAMFVVELPDGTCCYAAVTEIKFVDKEADHEDNGN